MRNRTTGHPVKPKRKQPKLTGPAAGTKPYVPSIALRSIDGHITKTASTVTAWYRLTPQRWSFRPDQARENLIQAIAGQYADLQGRWLHIRVTSRPYPTPVWAEAHIRNSTSPLPDVDGGTSWDEYMVGEQRQLHGRSMVDKEVYLGVELQRRDWSDTLVDSARPVLKRIAPALLDAELKALDAEIRHIDSLVAAPGLEGRPVTAEEMRWLLHRSCSLGLPAPRRMPGAGSGVWAAEDLAALTEGSDAWQEPYAPTVTVKARGGQHAGLERHVAVLTVGVMQPLDIPRVDQPWMQKADGLGIPVEWSGRIFVRPSEQVQSELMHQMGKVKSQVKHFMVEHDTEPPRALERQAARAGDIDDELISQWGPQHTRVRGWFRVAVSGASRAEALEYAQALLNLYKPKIAIEHPEAQYHLRREFIPGEPLTSQAYMRRGSVSFAASAVPTATSDVGDRRGILLGETVGATRHPVAWDPWLAQEIRDKSGLTAVVAGLGGGKSFLCGGVVYKTLRAGARWTILDPSGPLAKLCGTPELKPFARAVNLLNAEPGILNPYRVVPEPKTEYFADEPDRDRAYHRALLEAQATRRRLTEDVLVGVLPYQLASMPQSRLVMKRAVREVGGAADRHPGMVIDELLRDNTGLRDHALSLHGFLDELRDRLRLLIPEADADPYGTPSDDRLTVLTMPGLTLPKEGIAREHWTDAEALGVELLSLAAWLTQRNVYSGPPGFEQDYGYPWKDARKGVMIDEAFFLTEVPAGRVLMQRFVRDSRKWNVRVLLSTQIPSDFLKIQGFAALVDSVFVGRLEDEEIQADALRLLGIPPGLGYEGVLATLSRSPGAHTSIDGQPQRDRSPRQFVFSDGAGGKERIRIDFSGPHLASLRQALNTTPGREHRTPPPAIQAVLDNDKRGAREATGDYDEASSNAETAAGKNEAKDLGGVA